MVENDVERGIYHTLLEPCKGVYKEKMSKFFAFVLPVESKEDIKEQLNLFHKEYHDARHICYAYILGADSSQSYSTDDGEPSGTAGKPILTQLYSTGITNILAVVVRYFGGIKLGTGPLSVAYKESVSIALQEAKIIERQLMEEIAFSFPYNLISSVEYLAKKHSITIKERKMEEECRFSFSIPLDKLHIFMGECKSLGCREIEKKDED